MSLEFGALEERARRRVALLHDGASLTGEQLLERAERLADALTSRGVAPRHRVALLLPNTPQFATALLAAFRLHASAVLLNPQLTQREITDAIQRTRAAVVVTTRDRVAALGHGEHVRTPIGDGASDVSIVSTGHQGSAAPPGEATVQLTSGSTGRSKLVARSTSNLADELQSFSRRLPLTRDSGTLCPCPLSHAYGLMDGLLLPLFESRPTILVDRFLPGDAIDTLRAHRPAVFVGVPHMYRILAAAYGATAADLASLRFCVVSGAPLHPDVVDAFASRFGARLHQQYGTTETGAISIDLRGSDAARLTVGRTLAGRELAVVGDDGQPVRVGEEGEITVRSPAAATGYLDDAEQTQARFADGVYFTGDLGRLDDDGELTITGRRPSFINVAGHKVDPTEVARVLTACDVVAECTVFAHRSRRDEEVVKAVIVARRPTSTLEIQRYCRRHLAPHKVPTVMSFVETLPRSATGKILHKYLLDS